MHAHARTSTVSFIGTDPMGSTCIIAAVTTAAAETVRGDDDDDDDHRSDDVEQGRMLRTNDEANQRVEQPVRGHC